MSGAAEVKQALAVAGAGVAAVLVRERLRDAPGTTVLQTLDGRCQDEVALKGRGVTMLADPEGPIHLGRDEHGRVVRECAADLMTLKMK